MLTKNGVCYDLPNSPFVYEWRGMAYFFSSRNHMEKFLREVRKREEWLNDSLSRRFKCTVYLPILADVQLYTQIETRGFYISCKGTEYVSPSSIVIEANLEQIGVEEDGTL